MDRGQRQKIGGVAGVRLDQERAAFVAAAGNHDAFGFVRGRIADEFGVTPKSSIIRIVIAT